MEKKDNLTAREMEVLEATQALSAKEVAEMEDFSIPLGNGEVVDIRKYTDPYPDPDIPLHMQIEDDGQEPPTT